LPEYAALMPLNAPAAAPAIAIAFCTEVSVPPAKFGALLPKPLPKLYPVSVMPLLVVVVLL
jgi:hypothetical protein